ncbi:MAG: polysaccharide pyruvyl transferase family protein [Terrisporobacter othiniensis]|uniref:polysaccharide pyruvyl transferase family protein n=1 Tax=Terrisporobacter othiniensis TaxID=1577792 RepID=UPI002913E172|nr:polysaccharide pyruvyl transferase family protein [Terrisporobacter othiniensis]MDU6983130.1 polysaccharide pyruvyl transferase family protein [Terrisporobacter othiniensis]
MKKIFLYGHNGSGNHGCEAIVRSTAKILREEFVDANITLASGNIKEDKKYGLNEVVNLVNEKNNVGKFTIPYINAYLNLKILKNPLKSEQLMYRETFYNIDKDTIALSIGGDNYCYPGYERFTMLHNMLRKKGVRTVLWGCSVEPSKMNEYMKNDLLNYDLIVARETLTYNALKEIGVNVKLCPDPAFQLNKVEKELPKNFIENNTVGINISPMVLNNETEKGMTMKNYISLIEYIINNTNMNIALVPHVIWEDNNDDRVPSKELYEKFKDTNRIILIEDNNCEVLKGYISKCRFFIGARTHSTIAAYSTCVPTLVVGYSIKAKGIAKDIFGTYEKYVVPVQDMKEENELLDSFKWIMDKENTIKTHLNNLMKSYTVDSRNAANFIK